MTVVSVVFWASGMISEAMKKWLDVLEIREIDIFQSIHFLGYEPPYPPSYGLNSTTTVLLEGRLCH